MKHQAEDLPIRDRVDEVCDRFEAEWLANKRPALREFLKLDPKLAGHQRELLKELLVLDVQFRRKAGESPSRHDYLQLLGHDCQDVIFEELPEVEAETIDLQTDLTLNQFAGHLAKCGLVSKPELQTLFRSSNEPWSVEQFAQRLIRDRKLTAYQASMVAAREASKLVLGQYVVMDHLGTGGMGTVYLAYHKRMKRQVAIKVPPPQALEREDAVERFYREVEAAAKLIHPNIVTAFDADEHQGNHFLVMEYVKGADLSKMLSQQGRLPIARAVDYTIQAARGLQFAHEQGIVHRDIKPGNLLVDQKGVVKILDLGLARLRENELGSQTDDLEPQLTQSGQILGTVDYMAPEQADDVRTADHRADIYSLGCTLFRLLTGRSLVSGETVLQRILSHRDGEIPSLREVVPDAAEPLDTVFQRMVAKQPEDRQQSMQQVIAELESCPPPVDSRIPEALPGNKGAQTHEPTTTIAASWEQPATIGQAPQPLAATKPPAKSRTSRRIVILGLCLVPFLALLSGITIYWQTRDGTVRIDILDSDLNVTLDSTGGTIKGSEGFKEIRLVPGTEKLLISKGDFKFYTDDFELKRGDRVALRVTYNNGKVEVTKNDDPLDVHAAETSPIAQNEKKPDLDSGPPANASPPANAGPTEVLTSDGWKWSDPVNLGPSVNSGAYEAAPHINHDGLSLYFVTIRQNRDQLLVARRATPNDAFGPAEELIHGLQTTRVRTSGDRFLIFSSSMSGGLGSADLWVSERESKADPWGKPVNMGKGINTTASENDGFLSIDGLTLVYRSDGFGGGNGIYVADRKSVGDPFNPPVRLSNNINGDGYEMDPCLSADGLTIVFGCDFGGGRVRGKQDLWFSTRAGLDSQFGPARKLQSPVNTSDFDENGPSLSPDGKVLYFHSTRPGGQGNFDIWMSRRVRKPE